MLEGSRAGRSPMTVAFVCLLPLTCLAPDIVEAVDGRQLKGLRLAEMLGNGPARAAGKLGLCLRWAVGRLLISGSKLRVFVRPSRFLCVVALVPCAAPPRSPPSCWPALGSTGRQHAAAERFCRAQLRVFGVPLAGLGDAPGASEERAAVRRYKAGSLSGSCLLPLPSHS